MTTRTDLTVAWELSPRIITVAAPSVELTLQDLVDTLRVLEDDLDEGLAFDHLINTAGKEDLGGGVLVGISATLQNAQIAFEPRVTPDENGTATSTGTTTLIDTAATFETNLIEPGAMLINYTDGSIATVVSVTNETTLVHQALTGGAANDWTIADVYTVTNEIQCNISGGNLVAVDSVGAALDPVFPTVGTQIVRTASSSATLQNQEDIEHGSYSGGILLDAINGVDGTGHPFGNALNPVKTWAVAQTRAIARGFENIYIKEDFTFGASDVLDGYVLSPSAGKKTITLTSGCSTEVTLFKDLDIAGTFGGAVTLEHCNINAAGVSNFYGEMCNCLLNGNNGIAVSTDNTKNAIFENLISGDVAGPPPIDCGGDGAKISLRGLTGACKFINKTGSTQKMFIDLYSARIGFESTVTAGAITVRGVGYIYLDNSTGTTFTLTGLISEDTIATATQDTLMTESYPVDGQSAVTPAQMLYSINQMLSEFARTGTTVSIKKRDGTEAFQLALDSATAPTSSEQST